MFHRLFIIALFYFFCTTTSLHSSKKNENVEQSDASPWHKEITAATSRTTINTTKRGLTCSETGGECGYSCSIYFEGYELCNNGMYCCAEKVVDIPGSKEGSLDPICEAKRGRCVNKKVGCQGGRFWSNMCDNGPQRYCCILPKEPQHSSILIDGKCGKRGKNFLPLHQGDHRVIGGRVSVKGAWPFMISLRMVTGLGGGVDTRHICGGSVISNEWGITAAHCVANRSPKKMRVRIGDFNLEAFEREETELKVETILVHPDYEKTLDGDIALIKFASPVKWNKYRQPICLPPQTDPVNNQVASFVSNETSVTNATDSSVGVTNTSVTENGMNNRTSNQNNTRKELQCWVVGWGATKTESLANEMKESLGAIWPRKACEYEWGKAATPNTLCFGDGDTHGPCRGDSGGPLLCEEGDSLVLEGIVSWGTPSCTRFGVPAVFTRVRSYIDWIADFTGVTPPHDA